jgi:hypothetical protein
MTVQAHQETATRCVPNHYEQPLGMCSMRIQVTLVIRAIAYPLFYFSVTRNINILSVATVEASAQFSVVPRKCWDSTVK